MRINATTRVNMLPTVSLLPISSKPFYTTPHSPTQIPRLQAAATMAALAQSTRLVPPAQIALIVAPAQPLTRKNRRPRLRQSPASQRAKIHAATPPTASAAMVARAHRTVTAYSDPTAPTAGRAAFPSPLRCHPRFRASQRARTHACTPPTASAAMAARAQRTLTAPLPPTAPTAGRAVPSSHRRCRRCHLRLHRRHRHHPHRH